MKDKQLDYIKLNNKLKILCSKENKEFYQATKNIKPVQQKKLISIINRNKNTSFGKEFRFKNIKNTDDYRKLVPMTDYEFYESYINRIKRGEEGVLTADAVLMLEPTSGSTSPSKFIPYTASLREEFRKGISVWLFDILQSKPVVSEGSFYWSITPASHQTRKTSGKIRIGFGDDTAYFDHFQQGLINKLSAVPFNVGKVRDINKFRRLTLLNLLSSRELTFISIWNPTFLLLLMENLQKNLTSLVEDIKDKDRAGELINIFNSKPLRYQKIWPKLSLISCWTEGNASVYIKEIKKIFPGVEIQGKGLIATEGFISFPVTGIKGHILSIGSHFFEFSEYTGVSNNETKLAYELEIGKEYQVIITTSGGLYRYKLGDIVHVIGFKEQCPLLRFIGRSDNISDFFGEKLNEHHINSVVTEALKRHSLHPTFLMLAPEKAQETGNYAYVVFIEKGGTQTRDSKIRKFVSFLEEKLQENYHYKYCRKLNQLSSLKAFIINDKRRAYNIYLENCLSEGKKLGNIKPSILSSRTGWSKEFSGYFI